MARIPTQRRFRINRFLDSYAFYCSAMRLTAALTRTTRKLTLTDAGAAYVAAARRILDQVHDQEREATGEFTSPRGDLVIVPPVQFGRLHVLPIINEFLSLFPDISIKLLQSDRNVDLVDMHADLAIRIGEPADSSMIATRVGLLRPVICASPAFLEKYGMNRPGNRGGWLV
ncbi:LysR substrate-binding domain-containing protein [Cupriavidus necator]|uniref:LysR substrate-binding domain-containing protein n=1 Tax=Cupriavidus necator TaxID=106590 RepID=UPI0039C20D03